MAAPAAMYAMYHAKHPEQAGYSVDFFKRVFTHIRQNMPQSAILPTLMQIFCVLDTDDFVFANTDTSTDDDVKTFISKAVAFRANNMNSQARNDASSNPHNKPFSATGAVTTEEGFMSCERCNSKRINWTSSHCRSMDEGMTVFAECSQCFKRWKIYS